MKRLLHVALVVAGVAFAAGAQLGFSFQHSVQQKFPVKAVAVIRSFSGVTGEGGPVNGVIVFTQTSPQSPVTVAGEVEGLTPGLHGFHVHQKGNLTDGCKSLGGHFNPDGHTHGGPTFYYRHSGDLGNIEAGADGVANVYIMDSRISLVGRSSVLGRGLVVHAGEDDLGKGGDRESLKTGNAGGRVGCAVIGLAHELPASPFAQAQGLGGLPRGVPSLPTLPLGPVQRPLSQQPPRQPQAPPSNNNNNNNRFGVPNQQGLFLASGSRFGNGFGSQQLLGGQPLRGSLGSWNGASLRGPPGIPGLGGAVSTQALSGYPGLPTLPAYPGLSAQGIDGLPGLPSLPGFGSQGQGGGPGTGRQSFSGLSAQGLNGLPPRSRAGQSNFGAQSFGGQSFGGLPQGFGGSLQNFEAPPPNFGGSLRGFGGSQSFGSSQSFGGHPWQQRWKSSGPGGSWNRPKKTWSVKATKA